MHPEDKKNMFEFMFNLLASMAVVSLAMLGLAAGLMLLLTPLFFFVRKFLGG